MLSPEERAALFDEACRNRLGISGDEFVRRWDSGDFRNLPDIPENCDIGDLAMMGAFACQES